MAKTTDEASLRRLGGGRWQTRDGRFTIEPQSGTWSLMDAEQTDELGLPLVRGPYRSLTEAKAAIAAAVAGEAPVSPLADRLAEVKKRPARRKEPPPPPPPVQTTPDGIDVAEIRDREYREGDGEALRQLWGEASFRLLGDDDEGLRRFARRNRGLFLVAVHDRRVVASAMGAWDGRRGWIYHVATAEPYRRSGIAARLVADIEAKLRELGCPRVNVIVREQNKTGARFWTSAGYRLAESRQYGKDLEPVDQSRS